MAKRSSNKQFNVRIGPELIARLHKTATKFGRPSGNAVAAEVIERYLRFWEAAEEPRLAAFIEQQKRSGLEEPADKTPIRPARRA